MHYMDRFRSAQDNMEARVMGNHFFYYTGKLYFWSIAKLIESVRFQGLKHGYAYYPEIRNKAEVTIFIASQVFKLSEGFHNIKYARVFGRHFPTKFYMYVSDAGRTSYCTTAKWIDLQSKEQIGTFITKIVCVSKKTRKPVPLPDFFFNGLEEHLKTINRRKIDRPLPVTIPQQTYRYPIKVYHSDTDMNAHVNQATYVRWCSDAASVAAIQKQLRHFHRHIELYPCRSMEISYLGEAIVNDNIEALVWETGDTKSLKVAVMCKGSVIFTMDLEFYDGPLARVSPHLESQL